MDVIRYRNQKVAVFGLGKAGKSAAIALAAGGAEVLVWDDNQPARDAFFDHSVEGAMLAEKAVMQEPSNYDWAQVKALVLSPGIPLTHPKPHPVVELAKAAGCPVICDIELLFYSCRGPNYIGITGTNGKSTTTTLIGHILKYAGIQTQIGGNLGIPALELDALGKGGAFVLEVSSYQLDLLSKTKFDIAVLLNITPDHLDRHGGMDGYVAAKKRIFKDQNAKDVAIIGVEDAYCNQIYNQLRQEKKTGKVIPISTDKRIEGGVSVINGVLYNDIDTKDMFGINLGNLPRLPGKHNAQNIAASYAAAYMLRVKTDVVVEAIHSFAGLRHRLQIAGETPYVRFVNDSKATNADATSKALASYPEGAIYWIAGGLPKEGGIASLEGFFPKIRHAFLIGQAEPEFATTLEGKVAYTKCGDLKTAFEAAARMAAREAEANKEKAVVLFSPACASFDQWKNFEVRGDAFCEMAEAFNIIA